ncbi:MAG: PAS domain S-box protein [Thermodesulfobacteriota bacterium]
MLRNRSIASFILYGLTILTVGVAAALQRALAQAFGPLPTYVIFYPAMMLSALVGGVGPGLLATGLGALLADRMFLSPLGPLGIELRSDVVGLFLFCFNGVFISLIVGRLRVARTEAEIARQSEERFRALADNIAQLAWMADGKGLAFWYNRRWYDYTGATVKEMEGSGWQKLHHPDHVQRVAEKMSYCLQNGEIWEDTIPLRGKDGQYRWFFSTAIPILDKAGKVWRWFGTHTDVTGLREAEQNLRRYELLRSQSRDIILFIRRDDGRILEANAAAVNAYGYTREELLTLSIHDLRGTDTQGLIAGQMAEANAHGLLFETVHRRKDGSTFPVEVSSRGASIDGMPTLISVIRDITERKQAEEALADRTVQLERMNRELVALNAELENFTYLTSHDLQEPLRTLTAFSDLLRKDLGQSLPERAAQDLGFITDAAQRMQTLIRDLLALSRAGRVAKKREKVSLSECVDQALEALAIRVNETGAEISRDKLPDVWGDSTLLTQLYQNLIGNALKFSGDQRPIIQLTFEEREGEQIFGVKDNGIGIEPKYTQQIFQPFKRLHGPAEYEGSGIGLAICRKIVERHGGKIWVESESGKGAHFRFTLLHRMRKR